MGGLGNSGVQSVQLKEAKVNLLSTGTVPKRQHRLLNWLKVTWSRVNKTSVTWGHINRNNDRGCWNRFFFKKSHFHGYSFIMKPKWFLTSRTIQYHFVHYYNVMNKFTFESNCRCVPSGLAIKEHCIKLNISLPANKGLFYLMEYISSVCVCLLLWGHWDNSTK